MKLKIKLIFDNHLYKGFIAVIDSSVLSHIFLGGSGVTSVVDENGKGVDGKQFLS